MKKGYARVSSQDQNLARQIRQLKNENCEIIYQEKVSGATTNRPELQKMLEELQKGDTVIVSDLTRISRSTKDLFELVDQFKEKGANLKSIKDTWLDLSDENPYSQFIFTVMSGLSQLERELTLIRQREGIAEAKLKGKYRGKPTKYTENNKSIQYALKLYAEGDMTVNEISDITKIGRATIYRKVKEFGVSR
ncbi:recombinase family protein [Neobacillus niacini]|uniref:recombinase family protein n=1 Tax=Neobacillus niacini TaxID=86668 RepID=UPI002FFDA7B1